MSSTSAATRPRRTREARVTDQLDLVIRSDRVVLPDGTRPAAVAVRAGRIAAVLDRDAPVAAARDVSLPAGQALIPGVVDAHVHANEPGRAEWEGFASATAAAAAGGVTTFVDMPLNSIPPTVDPAALALKRDAARPVARMDVGFWGGAIPSVLGRLEELHDEGVFGFKAFLSPSGVDEFPHLTRAELGRAAREIAGFGGLLLVHAEDPDVLDAHQGPGGPAYADFVATRPPAAELDAIDQVIRAVHETGVRAHILHLSTARALDRIRDARAEGLPLTVETCPHYLAFAAEGIPDGATAYKCCPPIRDAANRDELWQGLLDGVIDLVASDHSPATVELKTGHGGDFGRAWGGISGLQLSLAATWTAARGRGIPFDRVVGWMSAAPARLLGLDDRGAIRIGARADLAALATDETRVVDPARLLHRNPVSAFAGSELAGVVRTTWLAGEVVHALGPTDGGPDAAGPAAPDPRGRLLTRP
ncbi:allantoinase AllB [Clavibacter sp. km1a]|uniref:allantoinase AllB n=1 Tax=Clavibacter sp. km1a TaxID=3459136 RepID=UPI004040EE80